MFDREGQRRIGYEIDLVPAVARVACRCLATLLSLDPVTTTRVTPNWVKRLASSVLAKTLRVVLRRTMSFGPGLIQSISLQNGESG